MLFVSELGNFNKNSGWNESRGSKIPSHTQRSNWKFFQQFATLTNYNFISEVEVEKILQHN